MPKPMEQIKNDFMHRTLPDMFDYIEEFNMTVKRLIMDADILMYRGDIDAARKKLQQIKDLL